MSTALRRSYLRGILLAAGLSVLLAGTMTFFDWLENPAGIFHDAAGTHWAFVLETAWSWFLPGLLLLVPLTLAGIGLYGWYRRYRQRCAS